MTHKVTVNDAVQIIGTLQDNQVNPILYGSLGASLYLGKFKDFGDVDLLIPNEWLTSNWDKLHRIMIKHGYMLIDEHEHEFKNENGIIVAFASENVLVRDNIIRDIHELISCSIGSTTFRTLTAKQFKRAYEFSKLDGYRIKTRGKKDSDVVALLSEYMHVK